MKTFITLFLFTALTSTTVRGQLLKSIGKKLERKTEELVDKGINYDFSSSKESTSSSKNVKSGPFKDQNVSKENVEFNGEVIFFDDFSQSMTGSMATKWTSNGTGSVESVSGVPGQWLKLYPKNTYKIKQLITIPENFSLSFDVLTRAETELNFDLDFGFDYQKGVGDHYFLANRNPINTKASFRFNNFLFTSTESSPHKRSEVGANMSFFANDIMNVLIVVQGSRMRTYINNYKVLDSELIDPHTKKYFYLALQNDQRDADVYFSNFALKDLSPNN